MRIFPHKEYEIQTDRTKDDAIKQLQDATLVHGGQPRNRLDGNKKYFIGDIFGNEFFIKKRGMSFGGYVGQPIIKGTITGDDDNALITVVMETETILKVMFILIFVPFAIVGFVLKIYFLVLFGLIAIFAINFVLLHVLFNADAKRCIKILETVLKRTENDDEKDEKK